ncbi:hypothetical protein QYF36_025667 [Acer negundo]|nr:hypothetical protein QYF36_025667 [Acer negundo]
MVVWLFVALRSNAKVGYCRGSYLARYLVDVLDFKDNNIINFSSANNYAEALRTREIEAIFLDVPIAKLFVAKYCKEFIVARPTYKTGGFGFVFPRGSELIPEINKSLLNLSEEGGTSTVALVVYVVHCCRKLEDSMSQTTWELMFSVIKHYRLSRKVRDVESSQTFHHDHGKRKKFFVTSKGYSH